MCALYFVETSAEEEALLGECDKPSGDIKIAMEIDHKMLAFLDKLILYLRIVHSVDYYNLGEYTNEDSMPNRLRICFIRSASIAFIYI